MARTTGLESIAQRQSSWSIEIDLLRIRLADGTVVDPKALDLMKVFAGEYELWNVCRQEYDIAEMEELRDSIIAIGVQENLKGYYATVDGVKVIILTDGHRRMFACLWARQKGHNVVKVPLKNDQLEKGQTEEYYLLTQLKTNSVKQVSLTMIEQGITIKRFLAYGNTLDQIVLETGIKKAHLENCLAFANAPNEIQQLIKSEAIAPTTVADSINTDKAEYRNVIKDALELATDEATAKGKEKVKITSTHVKKAREKRQNTEVSETDKAKLLEDVMNADFGALTYSELSKINDIIRKHWNKR